MKRNDLKAVVAERGQVTIPKIIRDKLGITPGVTLTFSVREGRVIVSKDPTADPVSSVYGCLKGSAGYNSTDEYMREIRGATE